MNLDRRLLALAGAVRLHLVTTIGMGLAAGALTVLQAYILALIVGRVFLGGSDLAAVQGLLALLLGLIVARAGVTWVRDGAAALAAVRVKRALRERFFTHLVALGPAYASGERTGELATTALDGVDSLDAYFSQYLPSLALAALLPLTVLAFVFPLDPISGAVFLITAPLIPFFMVLIGKMADRLTRAQWQSLSRLSAHFLDVLQGLTTLKAFGRSREQIAVVARTSEQFGEATMKVLRVAFLSALSLELLATISTAIVAVQVGLRLLYGTIAFEQAFFVLVLAPEFYLPLRTLGSSFHAGMSGVAAAERIFGVLEQETAGLSAPRSAVGVGGAESIFPIVFAGVEHAYDDGDRPALRGVSFAIGAGEKVALVGPSGAGKSTIAHILLGFTVPRQGEVLIGGRRLADLDPVAWRRQVAWVPQNPYLFNASVAENLRLARPEAGDAEVERAARLANAHSFIEDLPRGYDTPLGERGARLSGGQAQRIALARAFLKDAPLLVLDEPSSNLDPEAEAALQVTLRTLLEGRAALIIAHRLSTVHPVDRILVLDDGLLLEQGRHYDLLGRDGLYRRLVSAYGGYQ